MYPNPEKFGEPTNANNLGAKKDDVREAVTITLEGTFPADGLAFKYKFLADLLDLLVANGYEVTSVGDAKPKLDLHAPYYRGTWGTL